MKLSIIVPAYNADKFISRCIKSVLKQTYKNFELIIVNDGSTDNTQDVIDEYSNQVSFITSIRHENQGVSVSRNVGIDIATGDYLLFLDADDEILPGYLKYVSDTLIEQPSDLLMLSYYEVCNSTSRKINAYAGGGANNLSYLNMFYSGRIDNSPCNKVFKATIIKKHKVYFPEGVILAEDAIFVTRFLSHCSSVCFSDEAYLRYMCDTGGVTKQGVDERKLNGIYQAMSIIHGDSKDADDILVKVYIFKQLFPYYLFSKTSMESDFLIFFSSISNKLMISCFKEYKWKAYYLLTFITLKLGGLSLFRTPYVLAKKLLSVL